MKKFLNYALLIGFLLIANISVFACPGKPGWHPGKHKHDNNCNPGTTEAPLDGGLLAILAGAGITYFVARKKGKNKDKE